MNAKKGRDAANVVASDVCELLNSYQEQYQGYLHKMTSLQQEIHNSNSDVDLSMIDITADCIDQCKTGWYQSLYCILIHIYDSNSN